MEARRLMIVTALVADLRRQSVVRQKDAPLVSELEGLGACQVEGKVDLYALAAAIDNALSGDLITPGEPVDDGKEPDELNAANDG